MQAAEAITNEFDKKCFPCTIVADSFGCSSTIARSLDALDFLTCSVVCCDSSIFSSLLVFGYVLFQIFDVVSAWTFPCFWSCFSREGEWKRQQQQVMNSVARVNSTSPTCGNCSNMIHACRRRRRCKLLHGKSRIS